MFIITEMLNLSSTQTVSHIRHQHVNIIRFNHKFKALIYFSSLTMTDGRSLGSSRLSKLLVDDVLPGVTKRKDSVSREFVGRW